MPKKPTPKQSMYVKHFSLSATAVIFLFAATSSAVPIAPAPAPVPAAPPNRSVTAPSPSLADFCEQNFGELENYGRFCRFSQWLHLNLKHAGHDNVLTGIPIFPGDTLRLESAHIPEAWVGDVKYDASEEKIVASSSGYLSFRADPQIGVFSVERLGIERCFATHESKIASVVCPDTESKL